MRPSKWLARATNGLAALALSVAACAPVGARAAAGDEADVASATRWSWLVRPEIGLAIWSERDRFLRAFDAGVHIGGRRGDVELLGVASFDLWRSPELGGSQAEFVGVFNRG